MVKKFKLPEDKVLKVNGYTPGKLSIKEEKTQTVVIEENGVGIVSDSSGVLCRIKRGDSFVAGIRFDLPYGPSPGTTQRADPKLFIKVYGNSSVELINGDGKQALFRVKRGEGNNIVFTIPKSGTMMVV